MAKSEYAVTNNFKGTTIEGRVATVTKLIETIINKAIENEPIKV